MSFSAHSLGRKICDFDDLLGRITNNSKKHILAFLSCFFMEGSQGKYINFCILYNIGLLPYLLFLSFIKIYKFVYPSIILIYRSNNEHSFPLKPSH